MVTEIDGPISPCFFPVPFKGNWPFNQLSPASGITEAMAQAVGNGPSGHSVSWGIPFEIGDPVIINQEPVTVPVEPFQAAWVVFLHTTDGRRIEYGEIGLDYLTQPQKEIGEGHLNELAAEYTLLYADGSQASAPIRRRHQIGMYSHRWGENCYQAVPFQKPHPIRAHHEQINPFWGQSQTRTYPTWYPLMEWLWAWQNPHPEKKVVGFHFNPAPSAGTGKGSVMVLAISAGNTSEPPLRWRTRRKAILQMPADRPFEPDLDSNGLLGQIQLDLGQVISAQPRTRYPDAHWSSSYNNQLPAISANEFLIEYTSHPEAHFHLWDGRTIAVVDVERGQSALPLSPVSPAVQRVRLRVIDQQSRRPVAVKLHVHGQAGEYLAPVDRHRILNPAWFEDYSVDFLHNGLHPCTYVPGETTLDLPTGQVFVEVSKGFEIHPVRKTIEVSPETEEIVIEVEKTLPWRERGWVSADTHVHFLSPGSAMLEGAGEGVNVVNLLASQWGKLMTNVGDFDGRSTWGSQETGGGPEQNGEFLVRVGTENRQHVLGHISLLGYQGSIIAPMTTGGPGESSIGDPIEILLTEWARQCRKQGGLVVMPHFPEPRAEHAASIIAGDVDALEVASWQNLYKGIDPYSLVDWYRYLNCGYLMPIVGGTDKMSAATAVGTLRSYARIPGEQPFTYENWMQAVRRAETFVTCGPLLEFSVAGKPMGSRITLPEKGGTLDVTWEVASVTVPATQVDLIVNGEVRQSAALHSQWESGSWSVKLDRSAWLALLVRGHYPDQPEIAAAHSSPVMVEVEGTQLLAAADAVTILDQIEGAMVFLDTTGTRPADRAYQRMRLVLQSAYRSLHNRLHRQGFYHEHSPVTEHS